MGHGVQIYMKSFNRIFLAVIAAIAAVFVAANYLLSKENTDSGRPYLVEISRLSLEIEKGSFDESRLADCSYVTAVTTYTDDTFYSSHSDHVIRKINGSLYRFDYIHETRSDKKRIILTVNILLGIMSAVVIGLLAFIRKKILLPFEQLSDVPYQLSKGKLTIPVKEQKSRFFGKFACVGKFCYGCGAQKLKQAVSTVCKRDKRKYFQHRHDEKYDFCTHIVYARSNADSVGTGTVARISSIIPFAASFLSCSEPVSTNRCASVGTAAFFTSSGKR